MLLCKPSKQLLNHLHFITVFTTVRAQVAEQLLGSLHPHQALLLLLLLLEQRQVFHQLFNWYGLPLPILEEDKLEELGKLGLILGEPLLLLAAAVSSGDMGEYFLRLLLNLNRFLNVRG